MYEDYFRFRQKPFSIAPDPSFLYLSERHREALAHLMYGLQTDGGFVLITGEVGTGKTTLIRSLIDSVPENLDVAFILNPRLTVSELLETLCDELGITTRDNEPSTNKHQIDRLNRHLLRTHALGRSTVVIIDEAQNLTSEVLEQIRLLTNLETNERKLLRVILLGQPELAELLDRSEMRQLAQRITARYHLAALGPDDTRAYVAHRLTLAGGNPHLMTHSATRKLYELSGGIPRLINVIADRALLGAYVESATKVSARIVRKAARETFGKRTGWSPTAWLGAAVLMAAMVGGAWAIWDRSPAGSARETATTSGSSSAVEQVIVVSDGASATAAAQMPNSEAPTVSTTPPTRPDSTPSIVDSVAADADSADLANISQAPGADPLARPNAASSYQLQRAAYAAVFGRWDAEFDGNRLPCNQAPSAGLQCLKLNGALTDVLRLDHAAVVELWDDQPEPYYAALLSRSGNAFTIVLGEQTVEVTAEELATHWYGTYIVLWKMPPDYRGNLQLGDAGPSVAWLRQNLAVAQQIDLRSPEPQFFDQDLQSALIHFQRDHALIPDGIAGPITWITVNSARSDGGPRLDIGS